MFKNLVLFQQFLLEK